MNKRRRTYLVLAATCLVTCIGIVTSSLAAEAGRSKQVDEIPRIQLAILLDTSSSMSGLINQARTQLWKIVNEFADARRDGKRPHLEVALYQYGKSSLPAEDGWIRMIVPLTDDLDKVSEQLFQLTTNGGDEYCGQVIDQAVRQLKWSHMPDDLKCIFIAGNEPFTQGPVAFRDACHAAAHRGITVSTIHCGPYDLGVKTMWAEGAKLADGSYMSIDHNQVVQEIAAPQDRELARLSGELNKTYVPFGNTKQQQEALARQQAQDANAASISSANAAARAVTKASGNYLNYRWDLCDACKLGKLKIEELKDDDLPEELREMTIDERKAYIEKMMQQRTQLQDKIKQLSEVRAQYVAAQRKKLATKMDNTLDVAIISAVRTQAIQKNFEFK